jgi:hypothetical protein
LGGNLGTQTDCAEATPSSPEGFLDVETQALYRNNSRAISLQLHIVGYDSTGRCQVYGMAVPAS